MADAGYTCKGFHHLVNLGAPYSTGQDGHDCGAIIPGERSDCNYWYDGVRPLCICEIRKMYARNE